MTQFPDLFSALAAPFDPTEVKARQQAGRTFHYVTARVVMNRLDKVLGPECWWDEYQPFENSVLCKLSIRLPDGQVLTKQDAGGVAGMQDPGDDDKSAFSDALKRAAVKLGVGRYLYRDGVATFNGEPTAAPPASNPAPAPPVPQGSESRPSFDGNPPRSGKALFAWVKGREEEHGVGLLKYLNNWGKLQELPGRMVEWTDDQVALAYAEACRKLQTLDAASAPAPPQQSAVPPTPWANGPPPEDAATLRKKLIAEIWRVAKARHATNEHHPEHWNVIAGELDNAPEMGGEVISDFGTCNDPNLLRKALAAMERIAKEEIPF